MQFSLQVSLLAERAPCFWSSRNFLVMPKLLLPFLEVSFLATHLFSTRNPHSVPHSGWLGQAQLCCWERLLSGRVPKACAYYYYYSCRVTVCVNSIQFKSPVRKYIDSWEQVFYALIRPMTQKDLSANLKSTKEGCCAGKGFWTTGETLGSGGQISFISLPRLEC